MTAKQVRPLVRKWQKLLCLTQWKKINILVAGDLKTETGERLDGCICWAGEYREAFLSLHADIPAAEVESTIVHELCHLLLEGHLQPREYDTSYEFGLNTLSGLISDLMSKSDKKLSTYEITCPCGHKAKSREVGHFKCEKCGRTGMIQWHTPQALKPNQNQYLRPNPAA